MDLYSPVVGRRDCPRENLLLSSIQNPQADIYFELTSFERFQAKPPGNFAVYYL